MIDTSANAQEHFDLDTITKNWTTANDDGLFENMAICMFAAGMKMTILASKWFATRQVTRHFDIDYVAAMSVSEILKNPDVVRHRAKWTALIRNAQRLRRIRESEGSFKNYIAKRLAVGKDHLLAELRKDFAYLGPATAPDFVKDIMIGGYKPDVHVTRILSRIGLFDGDPTALPALFVRLANVLGLTDSEIDRLLFRYGSGHKLVYAVCGTTPRCSDCPVPICEHAHREANG